MIKVAPYVLLILKMIAIPLLKGLIPGLKAEAAKTETPIDDALVGAFEVVIAASEDPSIFVVK